MTRGMIQTAKNNPNYGGKIMAIKLVQETTKCGLGNAKAYVDALTADE